MAVHRLRGIVAMPEVMVTQSGSIGLVETGTPPAPGAGMGLRRWEAGSNAGTLKLVAYAGTSTTGTTVLDNIGGGD